MSAVKATGSPGTHHAALAGTTAHFASVTRGHQFVRRLSPVHSGCRLLGVHPRPTSARLPGRDPTVSAVTPPRIRTGFLTRWGDADGEADSSSLTGGTPPHPLYTVGPNPRQDPIQHHRVRCSARHCCSRGVESGNVESCRTGPGNVEPCRTGPGNVEPCRTGSGHLDLCRAQSSRIESVRDLPPGRSPLPSLVYRRSCRCAHPTVSAVIDRLDRG